MSAAVLDTKDGHGMRGTQAVWRQDKELGWDLHGVSGDPRGRWWVSGGPGRRAGQGRVGLGWPSPQGPPGNQQPRAVTGPWGVKGFVIPGSHPGSDATLLCALGRPLSFSELLPRR